MKIFCSVARKETQSLTMKNPTAMPVSWRLVGLEALGDDFTWPEKEGHIKPYSTVTVSAVFQPARPIILLKKFIKVEVSLVLAGHINDRSFATAGPRLWNSLPVDVQSAPSLTTFRHKLKTRLFRQSYPDIVL